MGEDNRSNLCKILGVDYDEVFELFDVKYKITLSQQKNDFITYKRERDYGFNDIMNSNTVVNLINNADKIIRHKVFTTQEVEDAKVLVRVLEVERIYRTNGGFLWGENVHSDEFPISDTMFPSIKSGESYTYEQIIGGND